MTMVVPDVEPFSVNPALPMIGVVSVGDVANTTLPVPVVARLPRDPPLL